jgi:LytS/YehU family sensor histidine kinase
VPTSISPNDASRAPSAKRALADPDNDETPSSSNARPMLGWPGALPPRLQAQRVSPTVMRINYDSPRKLCAVARGIARGIAAHFNEQLSVSDEHCMHRGDRECVMLFTLREATPAS